MSLEMSGLASTESFEILGFASKIILVGKCGLVVWGLDLG